MKDQRVQKTGFAVLSVFIIWHAVGISIVGPLPPSELRENLMKVYSGYLAFFHLDGSWPFYSPNPFRGSILRYETTSGSGEKKVHLLTEARGKFDHAYFRYTNFYVYFSSYPKYAIDRGYTRSVVRFLCGQHPASENITKIRFLVFRQKRFMPDDYLAGKRPVDDEFLKKSVSRFFNCES